MSTARKPHPFVLIDAFTNTPYAGNPCAVVFDADGLSPLQMQAIAQEFNLSETAFVLSSNQADLRARYFTPAEEIPLAGHPTISTLFAVITSGRLAPPERDFTVTLELEAGVIPVEVKMNGDAVHKVTMSQCKPEFGAKLSPNEVLPVFGLSEQDLLESPIQVVSTGTPQLMVLVRDKRAVEGVSLDLERYRKLRALDGVKPRFFSTHIFCLEGYTKQGDTYARHFGIPPDMVEDPFTGSATGGMACYLWRYGAINKPAFTAEQGHGMGRPGSAMVEVVGERENIETVKVGGQAVQVMQGTLQAP